MKLQDLVFTDGLATIRAQEFLLCITANGDMTYTIKKYSNNKTDVIAALASASVVQDTLDYYFPEPTQSHHPEPKAPVSGLNLAHKTKTKPFNAADYLDDEDIEELAQTFGGMKYDAGKTDPSLILDGMPRALLAVAEVATFGAKKYARDSWQTVPNALMRYTAAKDRHRIEGAIAEYDIESCLLHAAHEAWNALAVLELKLRESEIDEMAFKHTLDDTTE